MVSAVGNESKARFPRYKRAGVEAESRSSTEMVYLGGAQVRNTTVGKEVQEARENRRVKYEWKILITTGDRSSGERYSREGLGVWAWGLCSVSDEKCSVLKKEIPRER